MADITVSEHPSKRLVPQGTERSSDFSFNTSGIYQEEEYSRVSSTLLLLREVAQAEDSRVDSILHLLREVLQAEDSRIKSNSHLQRQATQVANRNPEDPYELWLKEMRGWLLLVASLIATCAYTASVSPPGGFWQEDTLEHSAGDPILQDKSYKRFIVFRFFNSVALALSFAIMVIIMRKRAFTEGGKKQVRALQILTVGSIAAISVAHSAITLSYYVFKIDVPYLVVIFLILTEFITWFHSPFSKLDSWIKTKFKDSVTKIRQRRLVWNLIHIILRLGIIVGLVTLSVKDSRSTGYWGNLGYKGGLVSLVLLGIVLWWFGKN